jgi:hypothetical protein
MQSSASTIWEKDIFNNLLKSVLQVAAYLIFPATGSNPFCYLIRSWVRNILRK